MAGAPNFHSTFVIRHWVFFGHSDLGPGIFFHEFEIKELFISRGHLESSLFPGIRAFCCRQALGVTPNRFLNIALNRPR